MSVFDFILAGISGAIEPKGTGRLSGCRTHSAAPTHHPALPFDSSRGIPCPEPESSP
jgi:hypothetical protein